MNKSLIGAVLEIVQLPPEATAKASRGRKADPDSATARFWSSVFTQPIPPNACVRFPGKASSLRSQFGNRRRLFQSMDTTSPELRDYVSNYRIVVHAKNGEDIGYVFNGNPVDSPHPLAEPESDPIG